ncbi:hypothetical protein HNQ56_002748 [Anaerotaenia torta]
MDFIRFFLIWLVPGLFGAVAFSIIARCRTRIDPYVALMIDLLTFTTMITGLFLFKGILTITALIAEFECLSFTRRYILLSILVSILWGLLLGLLRRLFFWIRR